MTWDETRSHDVFLCHSGRDKAVVRELAAKLTACGLRVWLDEAAVRPGTPNVDSLEAGLRQSATIAVLHGRRGPGPWAKEEIRAALHRSVEQGVFVIPVLLPGSGRKPQLPLFLGTRTWVDLRRGVSVDGLERLYWGITGRRLVGNQAADLERNLGVGRRVWWRGANLWLVLCLCMGGAALMIWTNREDGRPEAQRRGQLEAAFSAEGQATSAVKPQKDDMSEAGVERPLDAESEGSGVDAPGPVVKPRGAAAEPGPGTSRSGRGRREPKRDAEVDTVDAADREPRQPVEPEVPVAPVAERVELRLGRAGRNEVLGVGVKFLSWVQLPDRPDEPKALVVVDGVVGNGMVTLGPGLYKDFAMQGSGRRVRVQMESLDYLGKRVVLTVAPTSASQ